MQFDRKQLVSIGIEHFCQQLLGWQQKHLLQTSFNSAEFPALARTARAHGLPSQRAIAAWSLWLFKQDADPQARQCLDSWLATPAVGAMERTLLLEIWLCLSHSGSPLVEQASLQAILGQGHGASDTRLRSQLALQEAARTWQLTCDCVVAPLEQALSQLHSTLAVDIDTRLQRHALVLQDNLRPLIESLRNTSVDLQQACVDTTAAQAAGSLDACWQMLESQTRHTLPRLVQALEFALENAQEHAALSAVVALEQAQAYLARIYFLLACLPSAFAGAIACTRIACVLLERGCLPALEALRQSLLQQKLEGADNDDGSRAWYATLSRLPEDFGAGIGLAVVPLKIHADQLLCRNTLGSALAQATLFNALQALESMLKPSLETLIEQTMLRPGQGDALCSIPGQTVDSLKTATLKLDEHVATLNELIMQLDQTELPAPTAGTVLDELEQSLQALIQVVQTLEAPGAHPSNEAGAVHRCASLLGRNLRESAALLAALSAE